MHKYFYVLYFRFTSKSFVDYLLEFAITIFPNCHVVCDVQEKYASFLVTSDEPIYPQQMEELEGLFGEYLGEVLYSHNNTTPYEYEVTSMAEIGPLHLLSLGAVLKFSLWDMITLRRYFFLRSLENQILNEYCNSGIVYTGTFLCVFLQSEDKIMPNFVDFYTNTIKRRAQHLFKITI